MDDRQIIDLWKRGLTVQQVSKQYIKTKKERRDKDYYFRGTKIC